MLFSYRFVKRAARATSGKPLSKWQIAYLARHAAEATVRNAHRSNQRTAREQGPSMAARHRDRVAQHEAEMRMRRMRGYY